MFPISSTALTAPQIPVVTPTSETTAVNNATVARVGSALDAPAPASVTIDLSPVASFLLTVSQSQQQLTQLQAAIANGAEPQEAARRAATLNEATQNVVNAFNLLPAVDFNQPQQQSASLLNNLVQSLTQQTATNSATQQQSLVQIGLTLQPPLLSDATGGLSLDNEVLRAAFNSNGERTTSTLQNTLDTFSNLATQFAEQLSAAGSASLPALGLAQQLALTPADLAANARLDLARAEIDNLVQLPLPTSGAEPQAAQTAQATQADDATQSSAATAAEAARATASAQAARQESASRLNATAAAGTQAASQAALAQNAAQQASAAQLAAAQAAARAPTDPLRANPALAAAIAAYNISDPAILGANARAAQASVDGIPRVAAVGAAARARGIGNAP